MDLATISFQPEAHQTAERFFNLLCPVPPQRNDGFTVTVVTTAGEKFDAEMIAIGADDSGFLRLTVAPWIESEDRSDRDNTRSFDIYTELQRIEVL